MAKDFKIQVPTEIVRSNSLSSGEFVLLLKLIDAYYGQTTKSLEISVDYKALMFYSAIKDQSTFKKRLEGLHKHGWVENEIGDLPRKGNLKIVLNKDVIPQLRDTKGVFTQLPSNVMSRKVIETVGDTGVRLLYYFMSYINYKNIQKHKCYTSVETIAEHLGITEKTVIKHNKILEKLNFIKIEKHETETDTYITANGKEKYLFQKFNNHYFLKLDKIGEFCNKSNSITA
ncbi:helix-turn-helix domain-containing protein [Bacillus sp. ISL-46]|uniref:helix-turn-helix domain-containing protein n=1 Tax=Bacillus sp. ISL-46 TaxID=2819129 RepID=UPI001BE76918|nr:helix-turn-helix domain-containing protein [Bacillus sp. ISL-46]MBT2723065.1 helix-turn-helix domain-containing protein [Bacillus sp. ISL-46]